MNKKELKKCRKKVDEMMYEFPQDGNDILDLIKTYGIEGDEEYFTNLDTDELNQDELKELIFKINRIFDWNNKYPGHELDYQTGLDKGYAACNESKTLLDNPYYDGFFSQGWIDGWEQSNEDKELVTVSEIKEQV